jgi:hypothetical protein
LIVVAAYFQWELARGLRCGRASYTDGSDFYTWSIRVLPRRGDTLQLPFNDPNLDKEATTNGPEAQNEGQDIRKER